MVINSIFFMSGCPSGLRKRSAKPCFVGSNPTPDSMNDIAEWTGEAPAQSHKLNNAGSNPVSATKPL